MRQHTRQYTRQHTHQYTSTYSIQNRTTSINTTPMNTPINTSSNTPSNTRQKHRNFSNSTINITIIDHNDPSSPGPVTVTAKIPTESDESQSVTDPFDPSHVPLNLMTLCQQHSMEIEGACGGELACSTCHVLLEPGGIEKVGGPGEEEEDMLDLAYGLEEGRSRLGCQVRITRELDGITIEIPEDPY